MKILVMQAYIGASVKRLTNTVIFYLTALKKDNAEWLATELKRQGDSCRTASDDANFCFQCGIFGDYACVRDHDEENLLVPSSSAARVLSMRR